MQSCLGDGKLLLSAQMQATDASLQLSLSVPGSPHVCMRVCVSVCRMLVYLPTGIMAGTYLKLHYLPDWGLWLFEEQMLLDIMMFFDF